MAISSDWNIDYTNKIISHIDGDLDYDTGAGTQPPVSAVIYGGTTSALGKILARSGTAATGTFTLTDVEGQFNNNETLTYLDSVGFDNVTNSGFVVGDTITGASSGRTGIVRKIEYYGGVGTAWGDFGTGSWTDNENIQVGGQTRALAAGVGADNTGTWTAALVNEPTNQTITQPTLSTILNFNADLTTNIELPRFAYVQNAASAPTATGYIQKVYGTTNLGSVRLIDVTGTWADNDIIYVGNKVTYNNVQSGQSFKVGDTVVGATSSATGKVLVDTGTKLTLLNQSGTFTDTENLTVGGVWIASVNGVAAAQITDPHATQNGAAIVEQLAQDGGIYNATGLNVVRDCNALYTFLQDTFDELGALDDTIPMTAQVKLQQYTLVNGWRIPDLSFRFLESGSIQDSSLDNIWTCYQTIGTVDLISDLSYGATSPQPRMYVEQDGSVLSPWWLPGHIDILGKVKTSTAPQYAATSTGQFVNGGTTTIFCRNFGSTYDHFETSTIAGVAPIPLATQNDLNNRSGTHFINFTSAAGFVVGEEFYVATNKNKRGIIRSIDTNTVYYVLTGSTQFANADSVTGSFSASATTTSSAPTAVVAGYGTDIIIATVDFTVAGTLTSGVFIPGETVTSSDAGTAIFMGYDDENTPTLIYIGNTTSDFNIANTDTLTGGASGAIWTASAGQVDSSIIPKNIQDGNGVQNYNATIFLDRTGASSQTLLKMYEWIKYRTRREELQGELEYNLLGGAGTFAGVQGRIYTTLSSSYPLVKASPFGTFAGGTFFGAQGVFIQDMAAADIRSYQLIDSAGTLRFPPNQQSLVVNGLVAGDRVAVFRRPSSTPGSGIDFSEYTVLSPSGNYNGTGDSIIKVSGTISTDIPNSGKVRLYNTGTGLYDSYTYTSVDRTAGGGGEFLISTTLPGDLAGTEDVYVPLIETQAAGTSVTATIVYLSDIPLLARVRRKGILPFEVEGTFGSGGSTITAIRTTDTIVD